MKRENIIQVKSMSFAIKIVKAHKSLLDQKEFVLSKQLLRSGTSIGANIREAEHAESKADFIHKLAISQKECNETLYWLELLFKTSYLSSKQFEDLKQDATELIKLLTSIITTMKKNMTIKNY